MKSRERIYDLDCGGGYGNPLERDVRRVLEDVLEGWVSIHAARDLYGVVLEPTVNLRATESLRASVRGEWGPR